MFERNLYVVNTYFSTAPVLQQELLYLQNSKNI